jgi:hypothetical protein
MTLWQRCDLIGTRSSQLAFRRLASLVGGLMFLLAAAAIASAAPPDGQSPTLATSRFKAVLIAGDSSAPVFDHATEAMRDRLVARQIAPADIERLSSAVAPAAPESATIDHVLSAIAHIAPAAGQGCMVFATSHGAYSQGLVLAPSENFLTPAALDTALASGCGDAPTVVIISGCFSGGFARSPMARANRIILTAAREDRPSFGCGTGFQYTFYDRCLLRAMDDAATWRAAYGLIRTCVAKRERAQHFRPSEPQAFFGEAVKDMPLPRMP